MPKAENLVGKLCGKWLVLEQATPPEGLTRTKLYWLCECQCERKTRRVVSGETLRWALNHPNHPTRLATCGCSRLGNEPSNKKHGQRRAKEGKATPTYKSWQAAMFRCENPNYENWENYGGKESAPITMCCRWRESFATFFADMGDRPEKRSLDRIDGDKGYWCGKPECPECGPAGREPNCRWATATEQARNKKSYKQYNYRGQLLYPHELAALPQLAVSKGTMMHRLSKGWPVEVAVERPPHMGKSAIASTGTTVCTVASAGEESSESPSAV